MQATLGIRRLWVLSLLILLVLAGCSAATEGAASTTATPHATMSETTTAGTPTTTTSTTTPPTTSTTTTTTTTTTAPPAPTTTEPTAIPERSMTVPGTTPPTIDGVIAPGEWESANMATMSNGANVYWQHTDVTLYVALDSDELGAVNLVLATHDALWTLHSSAALGSQLFTPGDDTWEQVHGYSWCCRSRTNDAERLALFDDEGWQANIGYTGDVGVVEYQVAIPWGYAQAALVSHTGDGDSAFWPDDLDAEDAKHITDNMWTDPELDPQSWVMLVPGEKVGSG